MSRLNFHISVAILSILILSQIDHALGSFNTKPDTTDHYRHDALIRQYIEEQEGYNYCSGTIISDLHVLTAAHCVVKKNSKKIVDISNHLIEVVVGIDKFNDTFTQIVRAVETIFLPSDYVNKQNPRGDYGDIAVLKLNEKLGVSTNIGLKELKLPYGTFTRSYNPLQPAEPSSGLRQELTTTGFGILGYEKKRNKQNEDETVPIHANQLYYSRAQIVSAVHCSFNPSDTKFCVEFIDHKKVNATNCRGDDGGALFLESDDEILGVASTYSENCDNNKYYQTYTRVLAFKDIIEAALKNRKIPCKSRRISFKCIESYRQRVRNKRYHKTVIANEHELTVSE